MSDMHEQLKAQVRKVADLRYGRDVALAAWHAKQTAFRQEHKEEINAMGTKEQAVGGAEETLHALVLAHYAVTKEKKPVPGVAVKEIQDLAYDEADAFTWAKEKGLAIVPESLDVKAFEKIVKALPVVPDFVLFSVRPRPDIDRDLTDAVQAMTSTEISL